MTQNFIDVVSFFYPFGNTPAVNFAQDLSQEEPARVLLLGCGDPRSILFTAYAHADTTEPLDFTCCDYEAAVAARNFLFISLLLDDVQGAKTESIWSIFYHFYLNNQEVDLLHDQAQKLLELSASDLSWQKGPYFGILAFYDQHSRSTIRSTWQSMCDGSSKRQNESKSRLDASLASAKQVRSRVTKTGTNMTGLRATSPVLISAMKDVIAAHDHFWQHGMLIWDQAMQAQANKANPAIACPLSTNSVLHYGLDPLLGYPLAGAYIEFEKGNSIPNLTSSTTGPERLALAARIQLSAWAKALRARCNQITIRALVGDAIGACESLASLPENLEACKPSAPPTRFNVIDTSNLIDHLGPLNLLVSVASLLDHRKEATLHTNVLVQNDTNNMSMAASLLRGDLSTMACLLGLLPVEYYTNASMIASDEDMLHQVQSSFDLSSERRQVACRLRWKKSPPPTVNDDIKLLAMPSNVLAGLLKEVYLQMFSHEGLNDMMQRMISGKGFNDKLTLPLYHRGSFATHVSYIKTLVSTDWENVMQILCNTIKEDTTIATGAEYMQELACQLYLQGLLPTRSVLYTETLQGPASEDSQESSLAVCITVRIPHSALKIFTDLRDRPELLGTPILKAMVNSTATGRETSRSHSFTAVQIVLGKLANDSSSIHQDHIKDLLIIPDSQRWKGQSDLFVSFFAPAQTVARDLKQYKVSIGLQKTPKSLQTFMAKLGPGLIFYEAGMSDQTCVFISDHFPQTLVEGRTTSRPKPPMILSKSEVPEREGQLVASLDSTNKLESMTIRISIKSNKSALESLRRKAPVTVEQHNPFALLVTIGTSGATWSYRVTYPIPFSKEQATVKIARQSGYIELVCHVSDDSAAAKRRDMLLSMEYPKSWAFHRLNPDRQPSIKSKQKFDWITMHVSSQFSDAERRLRDHHKALTANSRVNLKESLLSKFFRFTGVQGTQSNVFGLSMPDLGGVHLLILCAKLRLDIGNRTVFLDAAALPLSQRLVQNCTRFLSSLTQGARNGRDLIQTQVDEEELKLWHRILPVLAERCRTWQHKKSCNASIRSDSRSWHREDDPFCSCGKGVFPDDFKPDVLHWADVKRHAVRVAISPLYFVPIVEKIYQGGVNTPDACRRCEKSEEDARLSACARCKLVRYCSKECQKQDWSRHKASCKAPGT